MVPGVQFAGPLNEIDWLAGCLAAKAEPIMVAQTTAITNAFFMVFIFLRFVFCSGGTAVLYSRSVISDFGEKKQEQFLGNSCLFWTGHKEGLRARFFRVRLHRTSP